MVTPGEMPFRPGDIEVEHAMQQLAGVGLIILEEGVGWHITPDGVERSRAILEPLGVRTQVLLMLYHQLLLSIEIP